MPLDTAHAAAVWIPQVGAAVRRAVRNAVKTGAAPAQAPLTLFERKQPKVSCLVAELEGTDVDFMRDDYLAAAARAVALELACDCFALYAMFSPGEWLGVMAFDASGRRAWSDASDLEASEATLNRMAKKVGLPIPGEHAWQDPAFAAPRVTGLSLPYWRMMLSASKPPCRQDLLAIGRTPVFDLSAMAGWKRVSSWNDGNQRSGSMAP